MYREDNSISQECKSYNKDATLILLLILRGESQGEDKFASHSLRADHIDMFPMAVDDLLHDGESQSGSLFIFSPGQIGLIEPVPDHFQVVFRDADAGVLYGNKKLILFQGSFYLNDRIMVAELDGIVYKVIQHLLYLAHIRIDKHFLSRQDQFDGNGFISAGALEGGGSITDDFINVEICPVQQHSLCIQVIQY